MDSDAPHLRLRFLWIFLFSLFTVGVAAADQTNAPAAVPGSNAVTLPFELRRGHVILSARVNDTGPMPFMLDTGYGVTMLRSGLAEELALRRGGRITIVGIAGEKEAGMFEGPNFDFGGLKWKPRRVAAFPAGDNSRNQSRQGILGSGFFRRFVVEIDSQARQVLLHEPATFSYRGPGEIVPLKFKGTTPAVEAIVVRGDGTSVHAQFEIDSGCDSHLCIGGEFGEAHALVPTNAPSEGRAGTGGGTRTRPGRLSQFRLGKLTTANVHAEVFVDSSPVEAPFAGHIGWEFLRDYRVIFDYTRSRMILESPAARPPEPL